MQRQRVDYRGEHPHLVALYAVEAAADALQTAEDVAAADDDAYLGACGGRGADLFGV